MDNISLLFNYYIVAIKLKTLIYSERIKKFLQFLNKVKVYGVFSS